MNLLDTIKRILGFQDWKEATSLPGWRSRGPRMKKARTPFQGRERKVSVSHMTIEEFSDKDKRNERFQQLRTQGTPNVSKFSTVRENKSVWCVVRP